MRTFAPIRQQLNAQVDEARRQAEEENRARASLAQQLRNLISDFTVLKSELEDESMQRNELQKMLTKSNVEAQQWRYVF